MMLQETCTIKFKLKYKNLIKSDFVFKNCRQKLENDVLNNNKVNQRMLFVQKKGTLARGTLWLISEWN